MTLPPPYIAKDNKVINSKTNKVLKPSKVGQYILKWVNYQHKQIFNLKRKKDSVRRFGSILKSLDGEVYISKQIASEELEISMYKLNKLIDEGQFKIL